MPTIVRAFFARLRALADKFTQGLRNSSASGDAHAFRRLTAALARRCHTRWLSSRPGFPRKRGSRCFAGIAVNAAFKLSALRADRSLCRSTGAPKAARVRIAFIRPRGPHSLRLPKVPSRKAPLVSEIRSYRNLIGDDCQ